MSVWPEQCDCYTDIDGYWVLGPKCAAAERQLWHDVIESSRDIAARMDMMKPPKKREVKFRNVGGKIRLIEDVQLPED